MNTFGMPFFVLCAEAKYLCDGGITISPEGGPLSTMTLALAIASLNSQIYLYSLSTREIWSQRDQITGEQQPIDARLLIPSRIT